MRIHKMLALMVLAGFVLSPELSLSQPKDVNGWNKAVWGMTEEEIQKVFEGRVQRIKQQADKKKPESTSYDLKLHNLKLRADNDPWKAQFIMDTNTKRLTSVQLTPEKSTLISMFVFRLMEKELVFKYGAVTYKDRDDLLTTLKRLHQ